jgi:VIT1/CCC1 family predicted Fe2+/Mn2+ transporter
LVAPRIRELLQAGSLAAQEAISWGKAELVKEAVTNLYQSRALAQMGSANGALEIIGRATGLLNDKSAGSQTVQVTQIVINAPGQQTRIIDATPQPLPETTPEPQNPAASAET